jgi:lysozyme
MTLFNELIERIKQHEGCILHPYRDTFNHLTIGYGHNLDAKPITQRAARVILEDDINDAIRDLELLPPECYKHLNERRKGVLIEMIFNMGIDRLKTFKRMLHALSISNYEKASEEMLNSQWALQVKSRAKHLAQIMKEG